MKYNFLEQITLRQELAITMSAEILTTSRFGIEKETKPTEKNVNSFMLFTRLGNCQQY